MQQHTMELSQDISATLRALLDQLGVNQVSHSGQTLMCHLTATSKILQDWACRQELCAAGLFHSIYGTEMFRVAKQSFEDRRMLQQAISEDAENLVYLYGTISRQSLYDAAQAEQAEKDAMVRDFRTGAEVIITRERLSELLTLDFANTLEQCPRAYVRDGLIEIYRRAASILPPPAVSTLNRWEEIKKNQPLLLRARLRARFYFVLMYRHISRGLNRLRFVRT
jgi:(p)ppGpp synthase/HD superfamily hydrolase